MGIGDEKMKSYYIENVSLKRKKLLKSNAAKPFIDSIILEADVAITEACPALKMSEYMLYFENGNRRIFEKEYFARRKKCTNIMMAYWLSEDEKYLKPLIDHIFYICDEYTWCLPAHCDILEMAPENVIEHIDLFQAETARFFAETVMCVGDKLPKYVLDRMRYEIRRRILPSFEKSVVYWWETCKMNWATVCGAGCAMAMLYFGEDSEIQKHIPRFARCLDSYLDGIEDDGCCQEGLGYWGYGFGHFVILAQALKIYTDGKTDYFKNSKVKSLALYPQRIRMSESNAVLFSDAREGFTFEIGLVCFLKSIYSEVLLPDLKYGTMHGNVDSVSELLWFDENYEPEDMRNETHYFEKTQWYVSRHKEYSFAAKGGHNDEPHNHNDVGSFMITVGDEVFVADPGRGEYRKETFMPEKRYDFIQNSSAGHSVPVINGEYQLPGAEFSSKNVKASDKEFELDIEGAYKKGIINVIHRKFTLNDNKIILTDFFETSAETKQITERIISKIEPKIKDGEVDFGIARIRFDSQKFAVAIDSESFLAPNCIDEITLYKIDFQINENEKMFEIEFIIAKQAEEDKVI